MKKSERDRDHRDLVTFNRKLLRAIVNRDKRAKQYREAQRDLLEARRMVRTLIDRLRDEPVPTEPICSDCQHPLGDNKDCETCRAALEIETRGAYAHPENP